MKSKFSAATFLTMLIFAGCNRELASIATASVEEIPNDLVIVLERGVCFGACPVYKLTISADGSVEFEGRRFVKEKGIVRTTISQDQLKHLIAEFERAEYFTLQDRYVGEGDGCSEVWTDSQTVNTSITIAGKTKSVKHYHGCEGPPVLERLTDLENEIDEVVNSSQWFDENNQ